MFDVFGEALGEGLTTKTQARATCSTEYSHYDYVPNELADKVIASHKPQAEHLVEEEEYKPAPPLFGN